MGSFYWLKLKKDFYKRHDMIILEAMENGKEIELIYIKMLCEAIDHNGELRFNDRIAYTPKLLAPVFNTTEEMIKTSLSVLSDLQLIEVKEDGTIMMTKMGSFIGYETDMAEKKRMQRNLPTLKNGSKRLNGTTLVTPDMKKHHVDEKRYGGHGMQALDRALGLCEKCGSSKDVRIHHNNGYSNDLDDLVCLCLSCHAEAHNKRNGGHINIKRPPYVHHMSTTCPDNASKTQDKRPVNVGLDIEKDIEIEKEKDIEIEKNLSPRNRAREIPTKDEVIRYAHSHKIDKTIDVDQWYDFYTDQDWKIKGEDIQDWKALLMKWASGVKEKKNITYMENEYTKEHLKAKEDESQKVLDDLLSE